MKTPDNPKPTAPETVGYSEDIQPLLKALADVAGTPIEKRHHLVASRYASHGYKDDIVCTCRTCCRIAQALADQEASMEVVRTDRRRPGP